MMDTSKSQQSYINLALSYRGAERQAPSILSLALTFSSIMRSKSDEGSHSKSLTTEERLQLIIQEWHAQPGVIAKWHLDESKQKSVLNMLVGTTAETRQAIQRHLNFHRWRESSLSSDLLRSSRWLVSACPKNVKESQRKLLTVTPEVQLRFIENHIQTFCHNTKRVKASVRSRHRPSLQEWDKLVDYSCVMTAVMEAASAQHAENPDTQASVLASLEQAFMSRTGLSNNVGILKKARYLRCSKYLAT